MRAPGRGNRTPFKTPGGCQTSGDSLYAAERLGNSLRGSSQPQFSKDCFGYLAGCLTSRTGLPDSLSSLYPKRFLLTLFSARCYKVARTPLFWGINLVPYNIWRTYEPG